MIHKRNSIAFKQLNIVSFFVLMMLANACNGTQNNSSYHTDLPVTVENSGADCDQPILPDYSELTGISEMPDPFLSMDSTRIPSVSDWRCRRAEIGAMAQKYELGIKPEAPQSVNGEMNGDTLIVSVTDQGKTIEFNAEIVYPSVGTPPYPAMIGVGNSYLDNSDLDSLGVAAIRFPNNIIAEQINTESRGNGLFYDLYGSDHSASALMAWAWGISRLVDAFETTPSAQIDLSHLGVTGCSRNGKGALVAGAFDERIELTILQESGSGGSAGWRVSEAQRNDGQNVQTLRQIVTENVWFRDNFGQFAESVNKLPFDHHSLMGMIAPRALLVVENTGMEWLGNESTYTTSLVSREIWRAMGIQDRMGVTQVGGHNHCRLPESQQPAVNVFVESFLLDKPGMNTEITETDADFTPNLDRWAPWSTPVLE